MTAPQRKAYLAGVESGRFNSIKARILRQVKKDGYCSLLYLCRVLKLPVNTISGRVSELLDDGILAAFEFSGVTNFNFPLDQSHLLKSVKYRAKQRYERWLKLGQKNGWIE